jgi:peptide deformylase
VAILPVRLYGDPALRTKARPISSIDDTIRKLAEDMKETMRAYHGVGLAANQVGVLQRILVVDVPLENEQHAQFTLINPKIESKSGNEEGEEGCLSIPGIFENVKRALQIRVTALDEQGKPVDLVAGGYLARAIQHEIDHLDGVLFIDRLSLLKRQMLRRALDSLAKGEIPDGHEPPVTSEGAF